MTNLSQLKRLAEGATKGKWRTGGKDHNDQPTVYGEANRLVAICPHECVVALEQEAEANAAFIAACDPDTILALLSAIERAREALKANVSDELLGPCRLDHNSNCQAHYVEHPCRVAQARSALTELDRLMEGK